MFIQSGAGDILPKQGDVWYDQNNVKDADACGGSTDPMCKGRLTILRARNYGETLAQQALGFSSTLLQKDSTGMTIKVSRNVTPMPGISSCDNINDCPGDEARPDGTPVTWELETTGVVVGKPNAPLFAFATIPGEPFSALQLELGQASSAGPNTFLFGYANGYFGYFPDAQARQCVNALASPPDTLSCPNATSTGMCTPPSADAAGSSIDGELCYAAAACNTGTKSIATGPVYFDVSSDGVGSSAGEKLEAVGHSQITALCQQP
jgi:hypothetical protein